MYGHNCAQNYSANFTSSTLSTVFCCYISALLSFPSHPKKVYRNLSMSKKYQSTFKNEHDLPWWVGLWFSFSGSQIVSTHFLGQTVLFILGMRPLRATFSCFGYSFIPNTITPICNFDPKVFPLQNFCTCQLKWGNTVLQYWQAWSRSKFGKNWVDEHRLQVLKYHDKIGVNFYYIYSPEPDGCLQHH